jgi:hypothetical protein
VVNIEPRLNCELAALDDGPDRPGFIHAQLSFPALAKGERHVYAYRIKVKVPSRPIFYHQPTVPTKSLNIVLHFHPESIPNVVWPFGGVPSMRMPGKPQILLPLSNDGIYRKRFTGTNINLCYGLAWRWSAPRSAS